MKQIITNIVLAIIALPALAVIAMTPAILLESSGVDHYFWIQVLASVVYINYLVRCRLVPGQLKEWLRQKVKKKRTSIWNTVISPGYFLIALDLFFYHTDASKGPDLGFCFKAGLTWLICGELVRIHFLMRSLATVLKFEQTDEPAPEGQSS